MNIMERIAKRIEDEDLVFLILLPACGRYAWSLKLLRPLSTMRLFMGIPQPNKGWRANLMACFSLTVLFQSQYNTGPGSRE